MGVWEREGWGGRGWCLWGGGGGERDRWVTKASRPGICPTARKRASAAAAGWSCEGLQAAFRGTSGEEGGEGGGGNDGAGGGGGGRG